MIKPRKYQTKDKEGVKQFISEILEDIFKSDAKGLEDLNDITNNFEVFYVAEKDNTLIGTIGIKKEDGKARITRMYVKKDLQGKGVGKLLMEKAINYCKKHFKEVFLTTYEQMGSEGFYKNLGFKTVKKVGNIIYMRKLI